MNNWFTRPRCCTDGIDVFVATQQEAGTSAAEPNEDSQVKIKNVISVLTSSYASSNQPNYRKGGLIGLAATAIALMDVSLAFLAVCHI